MIIRTKEDFKGKYIKIPKNLSEKKFNKIIKKLKNIGYDISFYCYYSMLEEYNFLELCKEKKIIETFSYKEHNKSKKEISIKDFLKEEEVSTRYNCIPSKYMVFYGTDLREIKEDVEKAIKGFSYNKRLGFKGKKRYIRVLMGTDWGIDDIKPEDITCLGIITFSEIELKEAIKRKINFDYKGNHYEFYNGILYRKSTGPKGIMFSVDSPELTRLIINANELVEIIESEK